VTPIAAMRAREGDVDVVDSIAASVSAATSTRLHHP
jgi:hypothetical protein